AAVASPELGPVDVVATEEEERVSDRRCRPNVDAVTGAGVDVLDADSPAFRPVAAPELVSVLVGGRPEKQRVPDHGQQVGAGGRGLVGRRWGLMWWGGVVPWGVPSLFHSSRP